MLILDLNNIMIYYKKQYLPKLVSSLSQFFQTLIFSQGQHCYSLSGLNTNFAIIYLHPLVKLQET